jgi:hypothetical protein
MCASALALSRGVQATVGQAQEWKEHLALALYMMC